MKLLLAIFFASSLFAAPGAETVIAKEQFVEAMKTALPNAFCAPTQYFRKCFKITEDQCITEAVRATKTCLASLQDGFPKQFHQPKDGAKWGEKLGACAGQAFETALAKNRMDSADCKDPSKWK